MQGFVSSNEKGEEIKRRTKHFPNQHKMTLLLCRRFYSLCLRHFTTFCAIFDLKSPDAHDACAILIQFVSDILIMAYSIITFERHFYIRMFQKHLGCCFVYIYIYLFFFLNKNWIFLFFNKSYNFHFIYKTIFFIRFYKKNLDIFIRL